MHLLVYIDRKTLTETDTDQSLRFRGDGKPPREDGEEVFVAMEVLSTGAYDFFVIDTYLHCAHGPNSRKVGDIRWINPQQEKVPKNIGVDSDTTFSPEQIKFLNQLMRRLVDLAIQSINNISLAGSHHQWWDKWGSMVSLERATQAMKYIHRLLPQSKELIAVQVAV